jgi:hypothetical protein
MKSERRHELQHNDLAEWILKSYGQVAPYKNMVLVGGLLVVVLLVGAWLWRSHSIAQNGEAWNSMGVPLFQPNFADAQTIDVMQQTVKVYPRTNASEWATMFAGDTSLMIGTNRILTDKKAGIAFLTQARDIYAKALETLTIPAAREQAMFGKARAIESLIQDKAQVDEALAAYQALNDAFPGGMYKALADQRIEQLKKGEIAEFYQTLAEYVPKAKGEGEGPRSPLARLGNLPDNPPEEPPVPTVPVRPEGSPPSPALGVPEPSLKPAEPAGTGAPKTDAPKTETAKPPAATAEAPKTDAAKPQTTPPDAAHPQTANPGAAKAEAPKPSASSADAAKKDK